MPQTFLIIILLGLFAYLAAKNLSLAAALTVAILPSYLIRFNAGPIPLTLLEALIIILFFVWATKRRGVIFSVFRLLKTGGWLWLIAAWLIFAVIAAFISPNLRAAAGILKAYFIEPIIFLIVLVDVIKTKKDFDSILCALGFSALVIALFAVYQKFTGFAIPDPWQAEATRRVTGFYGYPNAVGLYLAPIATLYAGWLVEKIFSAGPKLKILIFQISVIAFSTAAIIFARSEGAYVGILAGLFFLGITNKKLRWPTAAAAAALIIIVAAVPQLKNYSWQQISFQDASGKVRLIQWQETWNMLRDRPLQGAGLAGYQETFAPYHKAKYIEIYLYPHNLFLNFWSELGLGGLIVFLLLAAKFFVANTRKILANGSPAVFALTAAMITILVHGLVDVPYFKNDLSIFFWILIGLSLSINEISSTKTG